ncbi:MAG: CPBP family intramembrane glutamic endopeptidase [Bacteroidales bacterium]|jgi:membrane protease YdiL (CAAX protease family)|nr:CPBP family intramembrane metalloprotease [Bacteroidales bacterium]
MKSIKKATLFVLITFVISFLLAGIYKLMGGDYSNKLAFTLLGTVYMFVPAISVLIIKKLIHKEAIVRDLLISFKINKWFVFAWFIMPIVIFVSLGISLLFPGITYDPEMTGMLTRMQSMMTPEEYEKIAEQMQASLQSMPINPVWLSLIQGLIAGITINAVAAFGEELGWRGFLLHEFRNMKFLKASLIIGFIWGIWHAPMILMGHNYPQHPEAGILMMTIFCMLLSPLLMYITIKAKSVIAAAIAHGTMNAIAGISVMMIKGGNDLNAGITGLAGFIAIIVFVALIFVYDMYISKNKIFTSKIITSLSHYKQ